MKKQTTTKKSWQKLQIKCCTHPDKNIKTKKDVLDHTETCLFSAHFTFLLRASLPEGEHVEEIIDSECMAENTYVDFIKVKYDQEKNAAKCAAAKWFSINKIWTIKIKKKTT